MDHVYLTGPQGTTIDVGSWIDLSRGGPDYGARDLVQAQYAQNALAEGGQFAYETEPIRRMLFPLTVPSGGVGGNSLDTIESLLHLCARPGAYVDIQPDGTPTANMTRFDVIGGRVNHDPYTVPVQRAARRFLSLGLDVQPYGYWPTSIILASAASVALPAVVALPAIIGDAPGIVDLRVNPEPAGAVNTGSQYPPGEWHTDMVMWSLNGRPTPFSALLNGGSFAVQAVVGSVTTDQYAPASQALILVPTSVASFAYVANYTIPASYAPAFGGRHRAFIYAKLSPSVGWPLRLSLDVTPFSLGGLASAAPVATVQPMAASYNGAAGVAPAVYGASPAYSIIDVGEIVFPASKFSAQNLRVWVSIPSALPTVQLSIGGVYLLPAEHAGILPRGLMLPSSNAMAMLEAQPHWEPKVGVTLRHITTPSVIYGDGRRTYQGPMPLIGASVTRLDLETGYRKKPLASAVLAASAFECEPLIRANFGPAAYSISYTPRFHFLRGF